MFNPGLYNRLKSLFGEVRISSGGVPFVAETIYDPFRDKLKSVIRQRGEAYCVCCPFCSALKRVRNDTRFRLWVNHRWGTQIPNFNSYSLAICYNEDCLSDPEVSKFFRSLVEGDAYYIPPEIVSPPQPSGKLVSIRLPDSYVPLLSLPPGHPALEYLVSRGFDPAYVATQYGVGYVGHDGSLPAISNSLLIPVYFDGELVSWQARKLSPAGKVKYVTCPGAKISQVFYNWDAARGYDYAILVEGVFDVWRLGPPALALFGTHLSQNQVDLLRSRYSTVVVLLDGDAKEKAEKIVERLRGYVNPVLVQLPESCDPADVPVKDLHVQIANALLRRL